MNIDDFDWTGSPFDPEVKASEGSDAVGSAAGNDFASFDWSGTPFEAEVPSEDQPSALEDVYTSLKLGGYNTLGTFGALYGVFTGDVDNWASNIADEGAKRLGQEKSEDLKLLEEDRRAAVESADGEIAKAGAAVWKTVSSPTLFANFIAEQAAMLGPIGAAGRGAKGLALLFGTAKSTAAKVGTAAAVGTGAGMQTGDVSQDTYDELIGLPQKLWEENPKFQALRKEVGDEEAKHQIALGHVRAVAPLIAGVSIGTQILTPGGMTLDKVLAGSPLAKGAKSRAGRALRGFFGELTQEATEEGSSKALGNVAVSQVDPAKEISEGVGEAAGLGAIGGGVFGAGAGALSMEPDAGQHVRTAIDVDEAVQKAKEAASRGFEGPMMPTEGPPLPPNGPTLPPSKVLEQQALGGFVGDAVTMEPGVDIPQPVLDERNTRPTESSTLSGSKTLSLTDRELINELKRANDIPVEVDQKKNLAATKLDTAPNTQIQDQLVESAKRTLPDTLTPKRGFYASQGQAEHALRGKMQTTNEAKRAALGQFQAVESNPGQWVLQRKKAKELPAIPSDRTVTRAEVVSALNDSGLTSERQQAEVFDGLVESSPNVFKLADVQETLNRFDLKTPEGAPVVETGLQPAVQKAFPTGKVETLESGSVRVTLPNKTRVLVHPDQTIEVDSKSAKAGYGPKYKGQKKAAGSFQRVGLDGIMRLAKEADQETVDHEAFHVAWNVLTDKERSALERKHGSEEGAAKAYASWKPQQKNGIFEKIMRFFRRIRETLFGPTAKGAMERVAKGEVFERAPKPESKTSYDIKEKSQKKEEAKPEPRKEPQGEAEPQQAAEPKTQSEKGRIGQNLNLVTIQLEDETGATRPVRADVALADADQRIQMLEQLKECLS